MIKKKQIIGIELGTACLKAAVIEFDGKMLLLREHAIQPSEGIDLVAALGLLLSKLKSPCRDCAIAARPESAIFRFFEHDPSGAGDIKSVLNPDAARAGQTGLENYVLDFVDVGKGKQSAKSRLYVACGVPRRELEAARDLFKKANYNILLFQLTPVAVFNAFQSMLDESAAGRPFLSADFGRKRSSISGGAADLYLMREIEWGTDDLRRALVEQGVMTASQSLQELALGAEALKVALHEALLPLVGELRLAMDELRGELDGAFLPEIYISGGLTNLGVLEVVLYEALSIPCVKWNPFRRMQATNAALKDSGLLMDLFRLQGAAGAAIQYLT